MGASTIRRTAVAAAASLGAVQAWQAVLLRADAAYLSVLLGTAAALGVVAAVALWWGGGFTARFTLVLVALLTLLGEGLLVLLGLPGIGHATARTGLVGTGSAAMLCAVVVLALLHQPRRAALQGGQ